MDTSRPTSHPSPSALRIELLGRFSVARGDLDVPDTGWRLGKARSLVKLLALSPGYRLHREQVIDLLWPELDLDAGANNLHQVLHVARRTLAPLAPEVRPNQLVRLQQQMVALDSPDGVWVDALAFEHGASAALATDDPAPAYAAVELYHGDLLPEDLYEDWAAERREALRQQYLAVLKRLAAFHEARREAPEAIDALRRTLVAEPANEEAHVGLMRLYALTGRRQQALRQFERLSEALERELDVRPEPITVELHAAIQAEVWPTEVWGEPAQTAPVAPAAALDLSAPITAFAGLGRDFVGREPELARLQIILQDVVRGQDEIVLIAGEAGIGKTRTLEEFTRYARAHSLTVLWGSAYEGDGAPAYWPWVQVIRAYISGRGPTALQTVMGPGAADIARIVPELRRALPDLPEPAPLDPSGERFRLFDSMTTFLKSAAADEPLVLIFDDVQWADRSSLALLEFLARETRASRLLVLAAYRQVEVERGHPLLHTLGELARREHLERINLTGLTIEQIAGYCRFATGREPPNGLAEAIHDQSEGNSFFVREIVRLLIDEQRLDRPEDVRSWRLAIPAGIRETIALRAGGLTDIAHRLVTVAAISGREFELPIVAQVADLDELAALDAIEETVHAGLIEEVPAAIGAFQFVHAIARETFYDELSQARRMRLHLRTGEALEQILTTEDDARLPDLAHHYSVAAPLGFAAQAVNYLQQAAWQATSRVAYAEGAAYLRQAIDLHEQWLPPDQRALCELHINLGDALTAAGESIDAASAYERAVVVARDLNDARRLARVAIGTFEAGYYSSYWYKPFADLLAEAMGQLSDADADLKVRVLSRLATALQDSPDENQLMQHAGREAVRIASEHGLVSEMPFALYARFLSQWTPQPHDAALEAVSGLIAVAEQASDTRMSLMGHAWRTYLLVEAGDFAAADHDIAAYGDIVANSRQGHYEWAHRLRLTMRKLMTGPLADAERAMNETRDIGLRTWPEPARANYFQQLFFLRRLQLRSAELIDEAQSLIEQFPDIPIWRCMLANLYLDLGKSDEAHTEVRHVLRDGLEAVPKDYFWLGNLALLAEACARLDGIEQTITDLITILQPFERRFASPGTNAVCLGPVSLYLGLLEAGRKAWPQAAQAFSTAVLAADAAHMRTVALVARRQLAHALAEQGAAGAHEIADVLSRERELTQELGLTEATREHA